MEFSFKCKEINKRLVLPVGFHLKNRKNFQTYLHLSLLNLIYLENPTRLTNSDQQNHNELVIK